MSTAARRDESAASGMRSSRRMSALELGLREAVDPQSIPEDELERVEPGVRLADFAFVDGTTSLARLSRKASQILSGPVRSSLLVNEYPVESEVDASPARLPPPPPPPVEPNDEVRRSIAAAKARRDSMRKSTEMIEHAE